MGNLGCFICIRMKMVTWEIGAITTKLNSFFLNTFVSITWFSHTNKRDCPTFISAPSTNCFLESTSILPLKPKQKAVGAAVNYTAPAILANLGVLRPAWRMSMGIASASAAP